MTNDLVESRRPETTFAVVVPRTVVSKALRVHPEVRRRLAIVVYSVDDDGSVAAEHA